MLHRSMPHSAQLSRFSPELLWFGSLAWYPPCLEVAPGATAPDDESEKVPPNPRLKLSACGRRLRRNAQGKPSILAAASASRSLSASRYTAAATMTEALWFSGARATSSEPHGCRPRGGAPPSGTWVPLGEGRHCLAARLTRPPLSNSASSCRPAGAASVGRPSGGHLSCLRPPQAAAYAHSVIQRRPP